MLWNLALALAAAPAAAAPQPAPSEGVEKLLQSCEAHKFETIVRVTVDGQLEGSRVKICGVEGQSDADWLRTLKDAQAKVIADQSMSKDEHDQLSNALGLEIGRVQAKIASGGLGLGGQSLLGELPPRNGNDRREYSALPPLPAPTEARAAAATPAASEPTLPRLAIRVGCITSQSLGQEEDCDDVGFGTIVVLHARDAVPGDTLLRFTRDGESRSEIPLGRLAAGKSLRLSLPNEVCSKVLRGTMTVELLRSPHPDGSLAQVVASQGPYNLRCL